MNLHELCCLRRVGYELQSVARSTVPQLRVRSLDANLAYHPKASCSLRSGVQSERDCGLLGFAEARTRAAEILPLKNDVGGEDGEGNTEPHDGLIGAGAKLLPPRHTRYHSDFEKNQGNGKAASHPLAVEVHIAAQNEGECDPGCGHPQYGVDRR